MGKKSIQPEEVISFWLTAGKDKWLTDDEQFDKLVRENFLELWQKALAGRLNYWRDSDDGLLALIIVFDQFPRRMFRNDPRAFCSDYDARKTANLALEKHADQRIEPKLRSIFYLPFEHSEKLADQEKSVELFTALNDPEMLHDAERRRDIILRFGRFPQRNKIVGRVTKHDEQLFLDENGQADR
ncbi:DUF924 family protein [uncultured Bartonella sp.]|uniref:DUF924 family protein n=1 Tax=uncultured Bartonella sp. TaxID=104108 RepID=UPI0025FE5484|nr:DUF924 family protein [uncultured Bartonella sp.]